MEIDIFQISKTRWGAFVYDMNKFRCFELNYKGNDTEKVEEEARRLFINETQFSANSNFLHQSKALAMIVRLLNSDLK